MNQQELANEANEAITLWAKGTDKIVIAIDGYTGIGKTTLLLNLIKLNPDIIPVHRDDFMFPREIVQEKLTKAEDRSKVFELEVCNNKKLKDFIISFKKTNILHTMDAYNGFYW